MRGLPSRFRFTTMTVERPSEQLQRLLFARGMLYVRLTSLFGDMLYVHESLQGVERVLARHRDLLRDENEFDYLPQAAYYHLPPWLGRWQQDSGTHAPRYTREHNIKR